MVLHRIWDWDDAYANARHIDGGERWPSAWIAPAQSYRDRLLEQGRAELDVVYGPGPRHRIDLFLPAAKPLGLVVFIHGGYWLKLDKSFWSHLARGSVRSGFAVAVPSYSLCPEVRISDITREVAAAIATAADLIEGPIHLAGHSAGGHLATRMICQASPLAEPHRRRVRKTVSISGVHDLRPLMRTTMNADLRIDCAEAAAESPALLAPMHGARLVCWVGEYERPEFVRQCKLLANIWTGLEAETCSIVEAGRHHFDVIDGLCEAEHPLVTTLLAEG